MAFDGVVTCAVANHLRDTLALGKIEKIYQPEKDELVFHIRASGCGHRLYISCSSSSAGIYLSSGNIPNPPVPLAFCMLLRKHLQGGRIKDISQKDAERIVEITFETMDELGFSLNKKLVVEIMGKHSNIILVNLSNNKIIDCIKRVSIDINRVRQLLPGIVYQYPPAQDKISFKTISAEEIESLCRGDSDQLAKSLLSGIAGISPAVANTLSLLKTPQEIYRKLTFMREALSTGITAPAVYMKDDIIPADFHVFPLQVYENIYQTRSFDTVSAAAEYYFSHRASGNRIKQKSSDLHRNVKSLLDKALLKKQRLSEDLLKARDSHIYQLYGELITANLHLIKTGDTAATVTNYYDGKEISIPLDRRYAPAKNAQIYFKKYAKSKTALKEKKIQLDEVEADINYLESVLTFIDNALSAEEVDELRSELAASGFLKKKTRTAVTKNKKPQFIKYTASDGSRILVGRNNRENDILTLKTAGRNDLWFHTKDIPGSHVILFTEGRTPDEKTIFEAAEIAAYHSKGRASENVPVDYTLVRYVKKPSGARPGMVIFTDNRTVYVTPGVPR